VTIKFTKLCEKEKNSHNLPKILLPSFKKKTVVPASGSCRLCLPGALVSYACRGSCQLCLPGALVSYAYRRPLPGALASCACRRPLPEALLYTINMKYYMKNWDNWRGVGTRDAGTSELPN
jgi:hypothetical protein